VEEYYHLFCFAVHTCGQGMRWRARIISQLCLDLARAQAQGAGSPERIRASRKSLSHSGSQIPSLFKGRIILAVIHDRKKKKNILYLSISHFVI